jgi:hypothetical protein
VRVVGSEEFLGYLNRVPKGWRWKIVTLDYAEKSMPDGSNKWIL